MMTRQWFVMIGSVAFLSVTGTIPLGDAFAGTGEAGRISTLRAQARSLRAVHDYKAGAAAYKKLHAAARKAEKRGQEAPPPAAGESPRRLAEIGLDALGEAAWMTEMAGQHKAAARLYRKLEREHGERRQKDRALWAAARCYRAAGDLRGLEKAYEEWRKRYGKDAANEDDHIATYHELAAAYAEHKRQRKAESLRKQVIATWKKLGSSPNSRGAAMAGEQALYFAEKRLQNEYRPFQITKRAKNEKQAKAQLKRIDALTKSIQDEYLALTQFRVAKYSRAGQVRYGEVLLGYTEKMVAIPIPRYVLDLDKKAPELELRAKFEIGIGQAMQKYLEQAKEAWKMVVDQGKQHGIHDRWVALAREHLQREFPDEYPRVHEDLRGQVDGPPAVAATSGPLFLAHQALTGKRRDPTAARAHLRTILAHDASAIDAIVLLAYCDYAEGDYRRARAVLDRLFQRDRKSWTHPGMTYVFGLLQDQSGALDKAHAAYQRAVELGAQGPALVNLGSHQLRNHTFVAAVDTYEKLTRAAGVDMAVVWNNLGAARRGQAFEYPSGASGRSELFAKAEAAYRQALSVEPGHGRARYNLGLLHLDADRLPMARGTELDALSRLERAKKYFVEYRSTPGADTTLADTRIALAERQRAREEKRRERARKRQQRENSALENR